MGTLEAFLQDKRNRTFATSAQLTLGQIIEKLEKAGIKDNEGKDKTVQYDFGSAIPTYLDSWRGAYEELALGYELSGHDGDGDWENTTAEKLLTQLKDSIGKTYMGYKGGDFRMTENTPVWVANSGNSDNTGIIDVVDDGYRIIIMTAYCEY